MTRKDEVVFSGSGGQGIITAAIIFAEAAVLHQGLVAVQSQLYGAQARGGMTRSDVIVSEGEIHFSKVYWPNVMVCLSQRAYDSYSGMIKPGGLLIADSKLVKLESKLDARQRHLPMLDRVMAEVGSPVTLNICMLGALARIAGIVSAEAIEKVLAARVPPEFLEMNKKAFRLGMSLGQGHEL